ncbi:MAG: SusC/RagA family TonB-linked outer membrane protein [Bacteroidales bacterium]|nr:SusC/RagA family TonB-linked outer membrane protein [Bacteroidales bacterium]MDY4951244.1 SusC/RagA family TonB-linked outer membrane protein [Prevotella sp.]
MKKKNTRFSYTLRGGVMAAMLTVACTASAQNQTVKGTILGSDGLPAVGATVKVLGTTTGAITDVDGNFTLSCAPNAKIEVSYVGAKTQVVSVGNKSTINVTLKDDALTMDEVVVTALGIKRQARSLGYSTTKVDGSDFELARDPNIGNALSGKIAGVSVAGNATGPTGSSRVIIRGNSSMTGNNMPLYVVDGVPFDNTNQGSAGMWGGMDMGDGLANINADDIESVQVLKGAAASALYGYRAGNGAILITTKSGRKNQPTQIEVNQNLTVNSIYDYRDWQKTFGIGLDGMKPSTTESAKQAESNSWGAALDGSDAVNFLGDTYKYSYIDNWDHFYRTGVTSNTSVAFSGSSEKVVYRFGASYNHEKSILPNAGNRQVGINMNTTYDILKNLHLNVTANYVNDRANGRSNLSDGNGNTNASLMYRGNSFDVRWLKGEGNWGTAADGSELLGGTNVYFNNPYWLQYRKTNNMSRDRLTGGVNLRWDITKWLYAQVGVTRDAYNLQFKQVQPIGAAADPKGWMSEYEKNYYENNFNFLVGANKTFGDWDLGATFGGNKQRDDVKIYYPTDGGRPFIVDGLWSVNNLSPTDLRGKKIHERWQINSLYFTANVGWRNQVFLNVTGRNDWFSTLSENNNSVFYPSVNLSWVFTDTFRESMPQWFDFGKVRAGWGASSNGTSAYQNLLLYQVRNYTVNGQNTVTQNNNDIYPNANLKPVHINEFEVGLNLSFFQNRLSLDAAWYQKRTTDDIVQVSTSSASGYSAKMANVGKITNNGVELMIDAYPLKSPEFEWNTTFNVAYNDNNVKDLGEGVDRLSINGAQSRNGNVFVYNIVGHPYGMIVGNKYKRDANGNIVMQNGLPLAGDQTTLGNGVYRWTGGWHNSFTYKGITLAFLIDFKFGAKIFSGTNYQLTYYGMHKNTLFGRDAANPTGTYVFPGVNTDGSANTTAVKAQDYYQAICNNNIVEDFVYSADFIKLRELSLGYDFKRLLPSLTWLKGLNVSFVARNLWTIMKHTPNIDPESAINNSNGQGLELNGYPATRNIGFNVNLKF